MQLDRPMAVVTSAVDGDVLTALAHRRAVASTAGQLQYYLRRHSVEGVRRSLRRLVAQGVVRSRTAGNTREYRLNTDHLAARAIIELATTDDRFKAGIAAMLDGWDAPAPFAALFGPAARGQMAVGDEIDLFLAYPDGSQRHLDECIDDLTDAIRGWTGNGLNLVTMAAGEVVQRLDDEDVIAVRRYGSVVYGSPGWLEYQHLRARGLVREEQPYNQSRLRNEP